MDERYTDRRMPRLVNVEGAADILGCSQQYAYRLAERGQLPGAKIGHAWIFRRAAVERARDQGVAGGGRGAKPADKPT